MQKVMRTVLAMAILMVSTTMVWAQNKSEKVDFTRDIMVNGTLVKKGNYRVSFDEQTGELSVLSGKTVVAKTPAKMITRKVKSATTELMVVRHENTSALRSVIFGNDDKAIIVEEGATQAVTPQ
jgi:hypothetical protein